ncbi:MAG: hypothetical protein HY902_02280 [Deltaproteobacteria bacterium]|nr:hypothetical protein [Deltaproteobacteria bacterium]
MTMPDLPEGPGTVGQQLHQAIRQVLMERWDPIGIADIAEDEYDGYVPAILLLLLRRASTDEVFNFLWWVETECMGLPGYRAVTEAAAARLVELLDELALD